MAETLHEDKSGFDPLQARIDRLRLEEAEAWFKYLADTVDLTGQRYEEVEPWSYAQLNNVLTGIKRRRRELGVVEPEPSES